MKKILIIHNNYRDIGGEDIAVKNEISFLKKYYEVETLYFSNKSNNLIRNLSTLVFRNNVKSNSKVKFAINNFKPDLIYIHNTWFQASLGIFDVIKNTNIKTIVKLHNFRYFCTRYYFSSNHLNKNEICKACGLINSSVGKINKYFSDSLIKSLAVINYGKKYFKILENYKIDILVLTDFHKKFLIDLGVNEKKITTYPNNLQLDSKFSENDKVNRDYIVYAGRISEEKGVKELIETFIKTDLKDLKLKIIGKGPILDSLKETYQNIKIEFIGEKTNKEVLNIISNSRAVVTATKLYEGQPTLLCEASSLGVPSIFPDTGGIKEFFPEKYQLAFEQFNYEDLKNKLLLLNNKEEIKLIGKQNYQHINEHLNNNKLRKIFKGIHE